MKQLVFPSQKCFMSEPLFAIYEIVTTIKNTAPTSKVNKVKHIFKQSF